MEKANVATQVVERLKKAAKNKEVKLDSSLKELGLDSLDVVDLLMEIEEEYNIEFENEEMLSLKTVEDVVDTILKKAK